MHSCNCQAKTSSLHWKRKISNVQCSNAQVQQVHMQTTTPHVSFPTICASSHAGEMNTYMHNPNARCEKTLVKKMHAQFSMMLKHPCSNGQMVKCPSAPMCSNAQIRKCSDDDPISNKRRKQQRPNPNPNPNANTNKPQHQHQHQGKHKHTHTHRPTDRPTFFLPANVGISTMSHQWGSNWATSSTLALATSGFAPPPPPPDLSLSLTASTSKSNFSLVLLLDRYRRWMRSHSGRSILKSLSSFRCAMRALRLARCLPRCRALFISAGSTPDSSNSRCISLDFDFDLAPDLNFDLPLPLSLKLKSSSSSSSSSSLRNSSLRSRSVMRRAPALFALRAAPCTGRVGRRALGTALPSATVALTSKPECQPETSGWYFAAWKYETKR